jgi:hypothetical protein
MRMDNVTPIRPENALPAGALAEPIPNTRPLYIFSLDSFCVKGKRIGGPDAEYDDGVVIGVADTLMALNFAGAECWVVSDRPVTEVAQTADWLSRMQLGASQVYLGYVYGSDTGMDDEDLGRLKGIFERAGNEGRWEGLPIYTYTPLAERARIILG